MPVERPQSFLWDNPALPLPNLPPWSSTARRPRTNLRTKIFQQALKNAGVYNGPVDGNLGPKSKKAIRRFQEKNGLKCRWESGTQDLEEAVGVSP